MNPIIYNSIPLAIDLGNNLVINGEMITHVTIPRELIDGLLEDEELTHLRVRMPSDAFIIKAKRYIPKRVIDLKARQNLKRLLTQKPIPGPTRKGFET
jgi:hypothetical protein